MAKVVAKIWKDEQGIPVRETLDSLVKRFKRKVANESVLQQLREKEFYLSPNLKKKIAKAESARRIQREEAKRAERELFYETGKRVFKRKKKSLKTQKQNIDKMEAKNEQN